MSCVTPPSFSILINGKPYGLIHPSRGILQGDLLSLYLFLLCAEGFTSLLQKAELEGVIHGVSICRQAPRISHLLFADDSLLFCQAIDKETRVVLEISKLYTEASGQCINMDKSSIYFSSNTSSQHRDAVKAMLGVSEVDRFEFYLGLPTLVGQRNTILFLSLKIECGRSSKGGKGKCYQVQERRYLSKQWPKQSQLIL